MKGAICSIKCVSVGDVRARTCGTNLGSTYFHVHGAVSPSNGTRFQLGELMGTIYKDARETFWGGLLNFTHLEVGRNLASGHIHVLC